MFRVIFKKRICLSLTVLLYLTMLLGCTSRQNEQNQQNQQPIKIGFSMDTLREEHWQEDKEELVKKAEQLGAELSILVANNDDSRQIAQSKSLVDSGVDVLMIVPHNKDLSAEIVEYAHSKGVPVVAYDRLILNSDVDAYVSIDHENVGQIQAEYATRIAPTGNYVYIGGAPTDYNTTLLRNGVLKGLQPYIDRGDIRLVLDENSPDWIPIWGQIYTERALRENDNNIAAVMAANDSLAGAAIAALARVGLAGKIPITGMDGDLAAYQRIVQGEQTMTVLKPTDKLVLSALEVAAALARKQPVPSNAVVNNGKIDVPSTLIEPVVVNKENIIDTIIKPGYETYEDIYKNVPESERPKI